MSRNRVKTSLFLLLAVIAVACAAPDDVTSSPVASVPTAVGEVPTSDSTCATAVSAISSGPLQPDAVAILATVDSAEVRRSAMTTLASAEGAVLVLDYDQRPGSIEVAGDLRLGGDGPNTLLREQNSTYRRRCAPLPLAEALIRLDGTTATRGGAVFSALPEAAALARRTTDGPVRVLVHDAGMMVEGGIELFDVGLATEGHIRDLLDQVEDAGLLDGIEAGTHIQFVDPGAGYDDAIARQDVEAFFDEVCRRLSADRADVTCDVQAEATAEVSA